MTSPRSVCIKGTTVKLLETLTAMRDLGNTVIVVEHDEETMRAADVLVDLGPGAGELGGEIVAVGTPAQVARNKRVLDWCLPVRTRLDRDPDRATCGERQGLDRARCAREHNLQERRRKVPAGNSSSAVTGVSGSGKSTLVNETLHKALAKELHASEQEPGLFKRHRRNCPRRQGGRHRSDPDRPHPTLESGDLRGPVYPDP